MCDDQLARIRKLEGAERRTYLDKKRASAKAYVLANPDHYRNAYRQRVLKPEQMVKDTYYAIRRKCKKLDLPFDLTLTDIVIPKYCPVLGIELRKELTGKPTDYSPSVDRIIPELGYVRGNIAIISYRANRIKNDATLDELERVTEYVRSHVHGTRARLSRVG
jgi:hypothetical protein